MVAKKKKSTKKQARPKTTKTKVVYRTKTVYVKEPKEETYTSPFGTMAKDTSAIVGTGMSAIIGLGVAGAIGKTLKDM